MSESKFWTFVFRVFDRKLLKSEKYRLTEFEFTFALRMCSSIFPNVGATPTLVPERIKI